MNDLTSMKSVRDELTVHSDNILLRNNRIVLPKSLWQRAVNIAHEGHQGVAKTKAFLRSKVWFPGMDGVVEEAVKNCASCQALAPAFRSIETYKMSELPSGPWENISIDFCGPLPSGNYLFVMVDEYSRYPIVEIVKSVSAKSTIPILDKVISTFGLPRIVKSDNGSPFQSYEFKQFAENMGFIHRRITPRWPRANSQAESFNKPLMKAIRSAHINQQNWKQEMYKFLRQYRATPHPSTGQTPYRLLFNREPRTKLPQTSENAVDVALDEMVRTRDSEAKRIMKYYGDQRNRAVNSDIQVGDTVLMKKETRGNKLQSVYDPNPRKVSDKKGSMVTVDDSVTRNVSSFKKISDSVCSNLKDRVMYKTEDEDLHWQELKPFESSVRSPVNPRPHVSSTPNADVHVTPSVTVNQKTPVMRRSCRERKQPARLKDFVLK